MSPEIRDRWLIRAAFVVCVVVGLAVPRTAGAVPSFARKYQTSCQTCHTVFPALNTFGEAFRRDGYRFPSTNGSLDSDTVREPMLDMGQEEYESMFPNSVWPDRITQTVPLSFLVTGNVSYKPPESMKREQTGNSFTWNGLLNGLRLYAAGSFSDKLSYMTRVSLDASGVTLDTGYLLWSDIVGPAHWVNVWVGRLMAPQLTSFAAHSAYMIETQLPPVSVAGLLNPDNTFIIGQSPADGVELNGILFHRLAYAAGWLGSSSTPAVHQITAEDVYGRLGTKIGGMSLDGEGPSGMETVNAQKPWAETSATFDVYGYHGATLADNLTDTQPTPQRSAIDAVGFAARVYVESLSLDAGLQFQKHSKPYPGTGPTPASPPFLPQGVPGTPDHTPATGYLAYGEIDYVLFPWLVPGVRAEYTFVQSAYGNGSLLHLKPGVSVLGRPNVKVVVTGDVQRVYKLPPTPPRYVSGWQAAGGNITPDAGKTKKLSFEQVGAFVAWSF